MPLELQIIRANEFIRVNARERLNYQASKEALATLARACWKRGLKRALLDLRALPIPTRPLFTPTELAALVDTFREEGFGRQHRLAVLHRGDPHGGARRFAFISRLKGWQVRAFGEFEEALLWLSEEETKAPEPGEVAIPIKQAQARSKPNIGNPIPIAITSRNLNQQRGKMAQKPRPPSTP